MKTTIIFFSCLVAIFCACRNRNIIVNNNDKQNESREESFILKSQIIDVIKEFEASEQKNRPYAVYFTDTNEDFSVLTRDTNVYVSFLKMNPLIKNVNYKGVLSIDSLTIAIFDKNGVGAKYYDSTKLTYISLEHLHRVSEEEGRYFGVLEVMNDSLIRWEGP